MEKPISPYELDPPTTKRLIKSIIAALFSAAIVLVTIVMPAEFGIDPTGVGNMLGLTAMHGPARTVQVTDVVGGNQNYREVPIPDYGKPVPLPNPAVYQHKETLPKSDVLTITLKEGEQTEIKSVLKAAQAILFSWSAEGGQVYVDFHGHDPAAGDEFWVRYEEQQSGTHGEGSLVAPFEGEHGWYWLNLEPHPVTIKLNISGYYEKLVDYGKSAS